MTEKKLMRPTDSELAILSVLWKRGASTVREVHQDLVPASPVGYTTVLKLMQIMTEKGLVVRDESERAHVYSARFTEQRTQRQLVNDLLDRAFGGSATQLVMQALAGKRTSASDLAEIRQFLDEMKAAK